MDQQELYILRTIDLASQADTRIKSNPPVGCVIVYGDRIIGEGYHRIYGQEHAEVNAVNDAIKHNQSISHSKYYVSLEPCGHHGKTPPCAELITTNKAESVYIFEEDGNPVTSSKGLKILEKAGIQWSVLRPDIDRNLLDRYHINLNHQRPKVILKFAQTADGMAASSKRRILISSTLTLRLVHKWRSECDGILIGTGTLNQDNPRLDNRYWIGEQPHRFVIGKNLNKPLKEYKMFCATGKSTWINTGDMKSEQVDVLPYNEAQDWNHLWKVLFEKYFITQLLVEGGPKILNSIISQGAFDEIRTLTSSGLIDDADIKSPEIKECIKYQSLNIGEDKINWYHKKIH
ncbi:MAG: bifunctional diaminohydroxyphosphoribosylaminopyrimidine deaminase/5-amino-6-(5-phosphoribosylamino)uracil reductase RibD [Saprospiraceae bacterium]|nr:bifunctional diaminohydroxyphosphoribosylaminopyrimidine deaminase/5-amino-6-(5-phosphoribosylamino)uracil reductase RibD [Saprospiraceae bacterium]